MCAGKMVAVRCAHHGSGKTAYRGAVINYLYVFIKPTYNICLICNVVVCLNKKLYRKNSIQKDC